MPAVRAFHNLSAGRFADIDAELDIPTLITGEEAAKWTVMAVAESIDGLRALNADSLANSAEIEGITPLLVTSR